MDGAAHCARGGAVIYYYHFPLDSWLLSLLDGWRLPFVVQPCLGNHGQYAITLWRITEK